MLAPLDHHGLAALIAILAGRASVPPGSRHPLRRPILETAAPEPPPGAVPVSVLAIESVLLGPGVKLELLYVLATESRVPPDADVPIPMLP